MNIYPRLITFLLEQDFPAYWFHSYNFLSITFNYYLHIDVFLLNLFNSFHSFDLSPIMVIMTRYLGRDEYITFVPDQLIDNVDKYILE